MLSTKNFQPGSISLSILGEEITEYNSTVHTSTVLLWLDGYNISCNSRLRGVPRQEMNHVVEWGLKKLDLLHFADRPAGTLSLGNKRKVSTAIALIGGPSLIFLVCLP